MNLVFHIGYHKTGTSWLQQVYFPEHPEIYSLCSSHEPWNDQFLQALIGVSDRKFDVDLCRGLLRRKIEDVPAGNENSVLLVSAERLSGHPFSGGYDSLRIAERIHACAPEARVLCVIRNQADMIESVYKQLVAEGLPGRLDALLQARNWKGTGFDLSFYEYDRLVDKYQSLFGSERFRMLPYELMRADNAEFLRRMCDFFEVPEIAPPQTVKIVNKSLNNRSVGAFRRLNYFRRSELNPFPVLAMNTRLYSALARLLRLAARYFRGGNPVLDERARAWIEDYYRVSNQRLGELVDFSITSWAKK